MMLPNGGWSYEGLHVLQTGDEFTIYDTEDQEKVIWSGIISLIRKKLFAEDGLGFWVNTDQKGQDRKKWTELFLIEHPARLITEVKE